MRREKIKKSTNQKQGLPVATMFIYGLGRNVRGPSINASYQVSVHLPSGFRGEDFFKSTDQKQELPVAAMFVNGSVQNVQPL
jgi:hypothetical protein